MPLPLPISRARTPALTLGEARNLRGRVTACHRRAERTVAVGLADAGRLEEVEATGKPMVTWQPRQQPLLPRSTARAHGDASAARECSPSVRRQEEGDQDWIVSSRRPAEATPVPVPRATADRTGSHSGTPDATPELHPATSPTVPRRRAGAAARAAQRCPKGAPRRGAADVEPADEPGDEAATKRRGKRVPAFHGVFHQLRRPRRSQRVRVSPRPPLRPGLT